VTYRRRTIKPAKPTRVAEVLEGYLKSAGLAERVGQATVVDAWAGLVGPRIAHAAAADSVTADGTLFVKAATNAWAQELSMMEQDLLELVNRGRRAGRVRRIRWLVGGKEAGAQAHRRPGIRTHGYPDQRTSGPADERASGRADQRASGRADERPSGRADQRTPRRGGS
jgi:predicted nucleic acid-binding Zn ribbon protein